MKKIVRETLDEGYGAGFSFTGGTIKGMGSTRRGGVGGGGNLGGSNMMYTYEVKPLNHSLEPKSNMAFNQIEDIKLGSVISGYSVLSNATPEKKKIKGIVHKIIKTDNNSIKYYVIIDRATQQQAKVDPLTAQLIKYDPTESMPGQVGNANDISRRREKLAIKESLVVESLDELFEKFTEESDPIKDLGIGNDYKTVAQRIFPNVKVVFYHADTDEFEYKNKKRQYNITSSVYSFLRSKDILAYVKENKILGYISAPTMASYLGSGSMWQILRLYRQVIYRQVNYK